MNSLINFQNVEISHKEPWVIVVYKFLKQWQQTSGKKVPTNYKEKCELKELIQAGKLEKALHFSIENRTPSVFASPKNSCS